MKFRRLVAISVLCIFALPLQFLGVPAATARPSSSVGPLHLDPATVSAKRLAVRGLPPRPTLRANYARWAFEISHARTQASGALTPRFAHEAPLAADSGHGANGSWAGYVNSVGSHNMGANWNVPLTSASTNAKYSSTWVGIGRGTSAGDPLIQAGTDQNTSNGSVSYRFWYEIYSTVSDQQYYVPIGVNEAQNVEVDISMVNRTVTFFMENTTTGVYHSYPVNLASALTGCACNTVDYIEENQGPNPPVNENLANFHYVVFLGAYDYNNSNAFQNLNSTTRDSDAIFDNAGEVAYPGTVASSGRQFTVYRTSTN